MCFPSEHNLRKLIYVLLHATKAWVQPRWFQWRSRKLMESRRELMKPSCFCTTALRAGIKRCQLHSRKAVQKNGNLLMGADVRLHRLPVLRKAKKPGGRPRVSKCWCWLGGKGFWSLLVLVGGWISQRLRPRGEGGRRNADPTNAFSLLSLAVVVDNSLALYAQLQHVLHIIFKTRKTQNKNAKTSQQTIHFDFGFQKKRFR